MGKTEKPSGPIYVAITLCLAVFLDSLGAALIIPLLGPLFLESSGGFLASDTPEAQRNLLYGVSLAIFSLCMFLSSPVMGSLSDRFGRKRVLMFCLGGSLAGYVLSALSIALTQPWLFLAARIIDGLTTGSMPIAQAALFDISSTEHRARDVGRIMLAVSLGYILAPLIGGVLSNHQLVSWFTLTTPFHAAALLTAGNMIFLQLLLRETHAPQGQAGINWLASLGSLSFALKDRGLRTLAVPFFFMQFGWSTYFQFLALFLTRAHGFTSEQVGTFLALIGLGFAVTFGAIVGFLARRIPMSWIGMGSLVAMAAIMAGLVLIRPSGLLWLLSIPGAITLAAAFSSFMALFSTRANASTQGAVMGVAAAISAFCAGISGLLSGFTANLGPAVPIWLALGSVTLSIVTLGFSGALGTVTPPPAPDANSSPV